MVMSIQTDQMSNYHHITFYIKWNVISCYLPIKSCILVIDVDAGKNPNKTICTMR